MFVFYPVQVQEEGVQTDEAGPEPGEEVSFQGQPAGIYGGCPW